MSVDPTQQVTFDKSIIICDKESISNQTQSGTNGEIRFNKTSLKFEGYNGPLNPDVFGNIWRPLTQDVASASELGVIRIGDNLKITSTGVLSSIASGSGRIKQFVISVSSSPLPGAADYQSVNQGIFDAIGTLAGNYQNGSITSNIGSPPSETYPFLILLSPGQYSETLNQIVLPDYVSIRGEENYNSVITQNSGNATIETGSMIIAGHNCEISNLVIKLADTSTSPVSNAIYSKNKNNIRINSCILTCNTSINTSSNTYSIYMDGGAHNTIQNCDFNFNSSSLTGNFTTINILNTIPRIVNNKINLSISSPSPSLPSSILTTGLSFTNCYDSDSIIDKTFIENLTLSNNYYNTTSGKYNTGIKLNNTPITIRNSEIEVASDPEYNNTNYGIAFSSDLPLISTTSSNIISFVNSPGVFSSIQSSDISIVNFTTLGFQHNQYISVQGSIFNDAIYKIKTVVDSSTLYLESGFEIIPELATENIITLKALYYSDIQQCKIIASTNSIFNTDSNDNYIFNLNNLNSQISTSNISPSFVEYTTYKTINVGKQNSDFKTLYDAMASISDNNYRTRYLIKIQSGVYQESQAIICKEYVNIEGNGDNNTTLIFQQSALIIPGPVITPTLNSICLVLISNMSITNISIKNESTLNTLNSMSIVLYNPISNPIPTSLINFTMENVAINTTCSSYFNIGIFLNNAISPKLYNVNIIAYSDNTNSTNIGIYNFVCTEFRYYNITCNVESYESSQNVAIDLQDSYGNLYNNLLSANLAQQNNICLRTNDTTNLQKLIQIYNSELRASGGIYNYSITNDDYYTVICNNTLLGENTTSIISSYIICYGCYDINVNGDIQSLNSRGQNEQSSGTLTIGDTAGKLDSTGLDNLLVGVYAGSNVETASYNTFLGSHAGYSTTTANNNTFVGSYSGQSVITGDNNTIIGSNAGVNMTTANNNTILGTNTGQSIITGDSNTLIGYESALALTTGINNTFLGTHTGLSAITSNNNTFIGFASGENNETGDNNTYLGINSGSLNTSGVNNVLIGYETGFNNLSDGIVAVGSGAGYSATTNVKTTFLGTNSGYNNVGDCNTFLGNNAGLGDELGIVSSTASFNTVIGNEAGKSLTTGARNVLIGSTSSANGMSNDSAGWSLTSGVDNVYIGVNSGSNSNNSINNVLIGSSVGTSIIASSNNVLIGTNTASSLINQGQSVIIGANAGNSTTSGNALLIGANAGTLYTGNEAFAIGFQAGSNVSGDFNMFMGFNSCGIPKVNTTGTFNVAIGPYTAYNLTTGSRNVLIGSGNAIESVGRQLTTGSDNTIIGFKAGKAIQTGQKNTLVGSNAGANLTSGLGNLLLGYDSGFTLSSGSYNVVLGFEAGYNLDSGISNVFYGKNAGYNNSTGDYNINIGEESGYVSTNNDNNICLGYQSGYKNVNDNNIFLGYQSGVNNTTGTNNICFGNASGAGNNLDTEQTGHDNIFLGNLSGTYNNSGSNNIFMGLNSGLTSYDGSNNIFLGKNSGSGGTTSHNIFIGSSSDDSSGKGIGYKSDADGQNNVFIGTDVGIENIGGYNNIFLGNKAGENNVEGYQNVYIGYYAGNSANDTTAINNIAIGSSAGINNESGRENILIGNQVASLTTPGTSYSKNIIIGSEAGKYINQDNDIFIGTTAGKNNTTGANNIFLGLNSGYSNLISNDNIIIGGNAGSSLLGTNGTGGNIYIGSNCATNSESSVNNVVIGTNAMTNGDSSNVIILGYNAGQNNQADNNIFIGSESGVNNTSGISNIYIGHETGYSSTTSNGNIIFGNLASSSGQISDNNIIFGNETAKNVNNKNDFVNNIVMGSMAGVNSSLSINSIMIGTNTVGSGTGGDVNIIMGNDTAVNLGDPHNYYGTTFTDIIISNTVKMSNVTIDITFGTGAYYYNYGDTIIIESLTNNYIFQSKIVSILRDDRVNIDGRTQLILADYPLYTIPTGSTVYVKNVKEDNIGVQDYSKSSSNMCIGDHCGYSLTRGSKNSAIGDNSMYSNKVGRYNISLGTESGYSLNTDNNLCLGIKAGNSLDSYKNTNTYNDFTFVKNTNTITSSQTNFNDIAFGTVFEIEGSSNNDARYVVNSTTPTTLTVQGFPNIIENGFQNVSYGFVVNSSTYTYNNFTYSSTNIFFNTYQITIGGINPTQLDIANLQYAPYITVSNSQFNDGIKMIDFKRGGISYNSAYNQLTFFTVQQNYLQPWGSYQTSVTISVNAISYRDSINKNSFNCNIFSNDKLNILFGINFGAFRISNDMPYFLEDGDPDLTEVRGVIVNTTLTTFSDIINQAYIKGKTFKSSLITQVFDLPNVIFHSITNSLSGVNEARFTTIPCLVYISGTQYNNGYKYITKLVSSQTTSVYFDDNYFIIDENFNAKPLSVVMRIVEIQNASTFSDIYTSSPEFFGNIINIKYRNNLYQNYAFGSYVIESFYKNNIALNNNLLKFSTYSNTPPAIDINISFCDNGIKTITNDYISSNDLIFQTSNIAYANITFSSSTSTITTTVNYEFVNIVAPVIIRISGSASNNGFYLVTKNDRPYKTLLIDSTFHSLINETATTRIKTKCISSYLGVLNLSYLQFSKEYEIFGSKNNDETKFYLYNDPYAKSNVSVYLDDTTTIVNDTYNDYYYSIMNYPSTNTAYGSACNKGVMFNFTLSTIPVIVNSPTSLTFTDTTENFSSTFAPPVTISSTSCYINNTYLTLSNTNIGGAIGSYDGLFWINTITYLGTNQYRITFNTSYIRNNTKYTASNPFAGASSGTSTVLVNQFVFINNQISITYDGSGTIFPYPVYNLDWTKYITGFGENAKFISFTQRDGCITFAGGSYNPSDLLGTVSNKKSLTFEIASYALNTSNIAVAFVEPCPSTGLGYYDESIKSYIINFGVPNPTTQTSNIYRQNLRPIIYSNQSLVKGGILGCIFNNTLNTITIAGTYSDEGINYSKYNSFGKTYLTPSFTMFYPGQIIYSTTNLTTGFYKVKSISSDKLTLYLDSAYSILPNNQTSGDLALYVNYSIYDTSIDPKNFNISTFSALNDYQIMTFKNPTRTGLNYTRTGFISDKDVAELYFPINEIDNTNSSNSCIVINKTYCDNTLSNNITKLAEICMNHTLLVPTTNIITNYTNMSFHNHTSNGTSDIRFYVSNNTITSTSTVLSGFLKSEYILVSGTLYNNYLYRINDTVAPTTNKIILSSDIPIITNESGTSAIIKANNINSSNIESTDLSVFSFSQVLLVSKTVQNNVSYTTNIKSNSSYSIYIDTPNVENETPLYCYLEKSMFIDETSTLDITPASQYTYITYSDLSFHKYQVYGNNDISFNASFNTITSTTTNLSGFKLHEIIGVFLSTNNNGFIRVSDTITPTTNTIYISTEFTLTDELNTNAVLLANNINSNNITTSNLSIYNIGSETLQISGTSINNTPSSLVFPGYSTPYSIGFQNTLNNETPTSVTIGRNNSANINNITYSDLSFHNVTVNAEPFEINYYISNNTITSNTSILSVFNTSEYIYIYSPFNSGLFRIDDTIAPTANSIVISSEYTLVNNLNSEYTRIYANNINSITSDLSLYNNYSQFIVTNTIHNNNYFNRDPNSHSSKSIALTDNIYFPYAINESPTLTTIGILGSGAFTFDSINKNIAIPNSTPYSTLRTGQKINIAGSTYNNGNLTISDSIIPVYNSVFVNENLTNESTIYAIITKLIDFNIIGEPIQSTITENYSALYNYEDAEGNNSMIGSFAGQYVGSLNNAIYNVIIGSRCGQINHGSGNILIGSESQLAKSATDVGNTSYNNKLVIYKNNLTGIPLNPLISGDFATGRVGINTVSPEAFNLPIDVLTTDTKLVVNGGAIANAFSPFTGCHIANFVSSNVASGVATGLANPVSPGMIVSTTGIVKKPSIINTFCTVELSTIPCDKRVFGVYAYSEQIKISTEPENIVNSDGVYGSNPNYTNEMRTIYYVAGIGEGCVLITNINGEIQNGDYITTSFIPGYGALQNDDILHSYTVAKCTETIDWNNISPSINYNAQLYKSYLSGCTYHSS